jgi:hypothetical protein
VKEHPPLLLLRRLAEVERDGVRQPPGLSDMDRFAEQVGPALLGDDRLGVTTNEVLNDDRTVST